MVSELLSDVRYRLRAVFRKSEMDAELDDEVRDHLEREAERHVRNGATPKEAMRQARIAFGGIDNIREETRDNRGTALLEQLVQDCRYAVRTLAKNPGFTVAAVLSLGLGIGANTAMFSALDNLLLRPLAVARPEELVTFEVVHRDGYRQYNLGFGDYERISQMRGVVHAATATSWAESFDVKTDLPEASEISTPAHVSIVTGNYFTVMGIHAARGRLFEPDDDGDEMGGHPVVVISDAFWQRQFSRAPDIAGRKMLINNESYTIIGVAPADFAGDWVGWPTDFWVPSSMIFAMHPESEGRPRNRFQFKVIARLEPAVSLAKAQAAADLLYARTVQDPPPGSGLSPGARLVVSSAAAGYSPQRDTLGRPLTILMFIVAIVLLIACANLANLQLARAVARQREIGLRLALGAARERIVRQLMTESVILALLGGLAGLAFAMIGMHVLGALARSGPPTGVATNANPQSVEMNLHLDQRVMAFAVIVSFVTSIMFGLIPAFRGSRVALLPALGFSQPGNASVRSGARGVLVVSQVALSVLLLIGTGLLVRTLRNLESQDFGFDRRKLLLVWALPGHTGRTAAQINDVWQTTQDRLTSVPGVTSVAVSVEGLLGGAPSGGPVVVLQGQPLADTVRVPYTMTVSPRFFETIGQPIVSGRDFNRSDTDSSQKVAIINESLAQRLLGRNQIIVGRRISIGSNDTPVEVVAVVRDARNSPRDPRGPAIYYPPGQNARRLSRGMGIVIRTDGDPKAVISPVRAAMTQVDPRLPLLAIDTMDEQLERVLFQERLITNLSLAFAALAVILSCVGLYGVVSYMTARRTHEIGIRIALGAPRWNVVRTVLGDSVRLASVGIVVGIAGALLATRTLTSLLYGIGATDPATITSAAILLLVVAAGAGFIPAHRASRLHPAMALRVE